MEKLRIVQICKSCVLGAAFNEKPAPSQLAEFIAKVEDQLNTLDTSRKWEVEFGPCMDICPDSKISLMINIPSEEGGGSISVSQVPTVESVVVECLKMANGESSK